MFGCCDSSGRSTQPRIPLYIGMSTIKIGVTSWHIISCTSLVSQHKFVSENYKYGDQHHPMGQYTVPWE